MAFEGGRDPLPIGPLRAPSILSRALPNDSVQPFGFQFRHGAREQEVTVLVEDYTVAKGVPVGVDGCFDARLRARHPLG